VLLKDVYQRLRIFGLEPNEVVRRLTALACHWPAMPSMRVLKWGVRSKRWEILEAISLSVGRDAATGADYLEIRDTRCFHPSLDEPVEFYVQSADTKDIERMEFLESDNNVIRDHGDYDPIAKFEREWKEQPTTPPRLYPAAALPPAPKKKPPPKKKRRKAKQRPTTAPPPAVQIAPDQQPENKTGPDRSPAALEGNPPKRVNTKEWIVAEAKRLKKANEIPKDITRPTGFAKLLEDRMGTAAETNKSIRPVGWRYIKNHLSEWGLWPIEAIKIA
jgi:hypothetical protein